MLNILMNKDPFGFKTQGPLYDAFRPKYPPALLQRCLAGLKRTNRYLDIATGTGQILLALAPSFTTVVGSDLSPNMYKVIKEKASPLKHVQIFNKDCLAEYQEKFDLVTVGQALHFFPLPAFVEHASRNLVGKEGRLAVLSYYVDSILPVSGDPIKQLYEEFYQAVKPEFDFNRDEMHQEYSDKKYSFHEHFSNVEKQVCDQTKTISVQAFIGYMKTYSGYNRYLERNPTKDPIIALASGLSNHTEIQMKVRYFAFFCEGPQQQ